MKSAYPRSLAALCTSLTTLLCACSLFAAPPEDLARGEAPLLFTGAEGEDGDATFLRDGQPIRGDEIWLWVPAVDSLTGLIDLASTGQFFKVWDSGPEAGPNGNDDDSNGIRGMDFDPLTLTFLISYENTTTTGFTFGNILDGDLMALVPITTVNGFITTFQWFRLFEECTNGMPGCIGEGDINALMQAPDGTLFFGSGGAQTILTDVGGSVAVTSSSLIRASLNPDPRNIGPDVFFEPTVTGCPIFFCPGIYTGQLRGFDQLATGEITFGTSGDYRNQDPSGNDVVVVGEKADILALPHYFTGLDTLERRTAEVLYSGSLFFQTPNVGNAELLDHDILDTLEEIQALIEVLGFTSPAGQALLVYDTHSDIVFDRGDCNSDGSNNVADVVFLLSLLFPTTQPPVPACQDACDGNDDGLLDIADAVVLLGALFGSPPTPLPEPTNCGVDLDDTDMLDCLNPSC